jgi:hypothetical protein
MARPRKKAAELTTEQAIGRLFPRRVVTRAKKEAEKSGKPSKKATNKDDTPE